MKSLRVNKKWVSDFEKAQTYTEELEILFDFFKEGESSEEEVLSQHKKLVENSENLVILSTLN